MVKKDSYQKNIKEDFDKLFEGMKLGDVQKHFLQSRWLDQVIWMEGKANFSRDRHYLLRITTIVGGIILPALVSLNINSTLQVNDRVKNVIIWSTFSLSQIVAISAAIEEFFHYGERWRHYQSLLSNITNLDAFTLINPLTLRGCLKSVRLSLKCNSEKRSQVP
ncbi:MAG: DUF4231 domain-containing protein [Nostoc sp. C3-bin3]|nr:DUF4231 domain-containing protein [Nostoc sp. C3-bin3]